MIVLSVLKGGGEYGAEHVRRLADSLAKHGLAELVCLSDVPGLPCETVPLMHNWRGWWSKMELFAHDWGESVLYVDLDTTFIDDPAPLWRDEFTMLENAHRPGDVGSGLMSWSGDFSYLYRAFAAEPEAAMAEYITSQKWGDQGFIRDRLGFKPAFFERSLAASYKVHCTNKGRAPFALPHPDVRVVYFHGKPRPWEVPPVVKHG